VPKAPETPTINDFCELRDAIDSAYGHLFTNQIRAALVDFERVDPKLAALSARLGSRKDRPIGDTAKLTNRLPTVLPGDSPVVRCRKQGAIALGAWLCGLNQRASLALVDLAQEIDATRLYASRRIGEAENQRTDALQVAIESLRVDLPARSDADLQRLLAQWSNEMQGDARAREKIRRDLASVENRLARLSEQMDLAHGPGSEVPMAALAEGLRRADRSNQTDIETLEALVETQKSQLAELANQARLARERAEGAMSREEYERGLLALKAELGRVERKLSRAGEQSAKPGPMSALPAHPAEPSAVAGAPLSSGIPFQLALLAGLLGMGALTLIWRKLSHATPLVEMTTAALPEPSRRDHKPRAETPRAKRRQKRSGQARKANR
jgi:hypothetical protein